MIALYFLGWTLVGYRYMHALSNHGNPDSHHLVRCMKFLLDLLNDSLLKSCREKLTVVTVSYKHSHACLALIVKVNLLPPTRFGIGTHVCWVPEETALSPLGSMAMALVIPIESKSCLKIFPCFVANLQFSCPWA